MEAVKALPFFILLLFSALGIGLIVANSVKRARTVTGIAAALVVVGCTSSGVFMPYPLLPKALQIFSRFYSISASMHLI